MRTSVPILLLLVTAPIVIPVPVVAGMQPVTPAISASTAAIPHPDSAVVFVGGMGGGTTGGGMGGGMTGGGMGGGMTGGGMGGGMTGGGMGGGMTGGGMGGGMTGGGMTGGGIGGGMTGDAIGGGAAEMGGGLPGNGGPPGNSVSQSYGGGGISSGDPQYYQCVTQQGHCSVASSPGSLRHGASCTCLFGGPGRIK